jgi:two-component system, NarL family, nitrate/nitrite response regulator NarL
MLAIPAFRQLSGPPRKKDHRPFFFVARLQGQVSGKDPVGGAMSLRIVVVSNAVFNREGLAALLVPIDGFQLMGSVAPADTADLVLSTFPDVVVIDSATAAPSLADQLLSVAPGLRVVAVAITENDESAILRWAQAGVAGFVGQSSTAQELADVIRRAAAGNRALSSDVAVGILNCVLGRRGANAVPENFGLTGRESQIAEMISRGLSDKRIASALSISPATVKNHVQRILRKLGVSRRLEAALMLRERQLS